MKMRPERTAERRINHPRGERTPSLRLKDRAETLDRGLPEKRRTDVSFATAKLR
jgi:hypothetical protein